MTAVDVSTAVRAKSRPRLSKADRRMIWRGLMFAAPASLLLLAIYIVPMLVLAGFSVTDYQLGALTTRFVGLGNFVKAFQTRFSCAR